MQFDFNKILKGDIKDISSIFSFSSNKNLGGSALGIDVGSSSIKVVQIKKNKGKTVLETYGVLSLGPYVGDEMGSLTNLSTENLLKALNDVISESNVTSKNGAISIPSSSSLIFNIELPDNIEESKLKEVVPMEARKFVPVPISEVALDWFIIPDEISELYESDNTGELKKEVFIVAIHNDVLIKYKDLLSGVSIHTNAMEMEIFGNMRSSLPKHESAPVLFIDFGASSVKVYIVESGIVRIFHIVNRGGAEITRNISQSIGVSFKEAEDLKKNVGLDFTKDAKVSEIIKSSIDYILTEANSIVLNFEKKYNKKVGKVVLVGAGSLLSGFSEYSSEKFNKEVVKGDPFSKIDHPAFLDQILKESGPEFSVAIGLALKQLS